MAAKAAAKKAKMDIAARLDQLDKLDQKEKSDDEEEEGKEGESFGLCFCSVFGVFAFRSLLLVAASGLCFLVSVFDVLLWVSALCRCLWPLLLARVISEVSASVFDFLF